MVKRKLDGTVNESSAQLYISCEGSGGLHLAKLGLMAGRLAGRPKKLRRSPENFKACCRSKYLIFYFV